MVPVAMSNTEITTQNYGSLKGMISSENMREQFAKALPAHLSVERFCRIAITAISRNPKLNECSMPSVMKCLLDLSAMGLEPDGRHAHLIPYKDECTVIVDYKGIVNMVRRDPDVLDVQCFSIRENDEFRWESGEVHHGINPLKDRGKVVATYTKIKWRNGTDSIGEPFSKDDAERARKCSKAGSTGPWKDHYDEMWKKSNIRRDSKMWPLSPEVSERIAKADEHEAQFRDVTPRRELDGTKNPFISDEQGA